MNLSKRTSPLLFAISATLTLIGCSPSESEPATKTGIEKDPVTEKSKTITCNMFDVNWNIKGNTLTFSLSTDLPDDTDIMVSVSRGYLEKGDSYEYAINYFSEKSTVNKYHSNHSVTIDDDVWEAELKAFQDKMAGVGFGFEVAKVSEEIGINFLVPINQSNPLYGDKNINLDGNVVSTSGLRTISKELKIKKPLRREFVSYVSANTSPSSLQVSITYSISKKTPLMPELEPANPELALTKVISLPPGTEITVLKTSKKNNTLWYNVNAKHNKIELGVGWINSSALYGQTLKLVI